MNVAASTHGSNAAIIISGHENVATVAAAIAIDQFATASQRSAAHVFP